MAANSTRVVAAVVLVLGSVILLFATVLYSGYTHDHALHGDAIALGIESLLLAPLPLSLVVWTTRLTRKWGLWWAAWGTTVLVALVGGLLLLAMNVISAAIERDGFIP
jgi:hypothetical protein